MIHQYSTKSNLTNKPIDVLYCVHVYWAIVPLDGKEIDSWWNRDM